MQGYLRLYAAITQARCAAAAALPCDGLRACGVLHLLMPPLLCITALSPLLWLQSDNPRNPHGLEQAWLLLARCVQQRLLGASQR